MRKLVIILSLILLTSCALYVSSYDPDSYEYPPVDFADPITGEISASLERTEIITAANNKDIIWEHYLIENPTSNALLAVDILRPLNDTQSYPSVLLIPGGTGTKGSFVSPEGVKNEKIANTLAGEGYLVLAFDADGRGDSTGTEDLNGYTQQDGLYQLYRFLRESNHVDDTRIGIVSFSYGVAMASGMIARYQPDLLYYIEWEGPTSRTYVTSGCNNIEANYNEPAQVPCTDEEHWQEREALRFIPELSTDHFIIVQSEKDHVQPNAEHSLLANNYAVEAGIWTRVNGAENTENTEYTLENFPTLSESVDQDKEILSYIQSITEES